MEGPANAADPEVVLKFERVCLRFDDVIALDNIDFQMVAGETRVILGAAGAGKTTLLKTAIGLLKPDSGCVSLLGRDITGLSEHDLFDLRAKVGMLFQEGGLFDSITVAENVAYPLVNQRIRKTDPTAIEEKVRDALRFVELEQTLEKFPSELSGGMRRRVGIARAVVTAPPLVLYDSPTAGLDPVTANTIMALIAKERDTANTANLIVTYRYQDGQLMANFRYNPQDERLEPAVQNGDSQNGGIASHHGPGRARVTVFMVMNQGRIVFEGTETEMESSRDDYVSKFTLKRQ